MAQRESTKAKQPAGRARGALASPRAAVKPAAGLAATRGDDVARLSARVVELERDLAAARQQISDLEALREQALNRIDWAIDSLHNVLDGEGENA